MKTTIILAAASFISVFGLLSLASVSKAESTIEAVQGNLSNPAPAKNELIERLKVLAKERGRLPDENRESANNIKYEEWMDEERSRSIPVKIYFPPTADSPSPVLIFSHGLGGSREAALYLGHYLSEHGYVCVFIQHAGSDRGVIREGLNKGVDGILPSMQAAANGKNLFLRAQDVSFVIDELERRVQSDKSLKGKLDLSKLAVAGHSFGAGTALAVSGQSYGAFGKASPMADNRIKAAIYLSPPANLNGQSLHSVYGNIKVPGLLMTGTDDNSPIGQTRAEDRRLPFDGIEAPHQYLINFKNGDHMIFNGRKGSPRPNDEMFQSIISKTCLEFLDAFVKGDGASQKWLDGKEALSFISPAGQYERK